MQVGWVGWESAGMQTGYPVTIVALISVGCDDWGAQPED